MTVSTSGELLKHLWVFILAFSQRACSAWKNWIAVSLQQFLVESNKSSMYVDFLMLSRGKVSSWILAFSWDTTWGAKWSRGVELRTQHIQIYIHQDHDQLPNSSKELNFGQSSGGIHICKYKPQLLGNDGSQVASLSWIPRVSISQNLFSGSLTSPNIGGLVIIRSVFLIMVFPSGGQHTPDLAISSPKFPLTLHLEKYRLMWTWPMSTSTIELWFWKFADSSMGPPILEHPCNFQ